jgi:hypothetical protein
MGCYKGGVLGREEATGDQFYSKMGVKAHWNWLPTAVAAY